MIFVTGGAGFIGSNFVRDWFASRSEPVLVIDKLSYAGSLENLVGVRERPDFIFAQLDINSGDEILALLLLHCPRALIHFAAETHVDRSIVRPEDFVRANVTGTFALLEAARAYCDSLPAEARGAFRFLHVSTDEVYGSIAPDAPACSEEARYAPNSPYAASKAASDHLVRAYVRTYGLPALTINCSNNYGPFQFPEKLIPLMILSALDGLPLPLYGDGANVRDWIYVGDCCAGIRAVLENGSPGEVYNIGARNLTQNIQVVRVICRVLDELRPRPGGRYDEQIVFVEDRPGHDRRYSIDPGKIERELGWTPRETFESGIRRTVEWYLREQLWLDGARRRASRNPIDHRPGKASERLVPPSST